MITIEQVKEKIIKRFWSKIKFLELNECWEWQASINSEKYGIYWDGNTTIGAHRFMFIVFNGSLSPDLNVCHSCDNTKCVNPNHFFIGTHIDNVKDRVSKGRTQSGTANRQGKRNGQAKILESDIPIIRTRIESGESYSSIAKDYNVWKSAIHRIKDKLTWSHIP